MKKNFTEIVFILDRSGSMSGLESDTIKGYNSMIKRQKKEEGKALITTVLFDNEYELLNDRIDINAIKSMDERDYYVRGTTALLDAIGKSIQKLVNVQKNTLPDYKPNKVLFVITTDGLENASTIYSYNQIKSMITHQKEKYNWEFIFLGANIDAIGEAKKFGINEDCAVNYHSDSQGTIVSYDALCSALTEFRENGSVGKKWREDINRDFVGRKPKNRR